MTDKQFNSEMDYQIQRSIINKMLKEKIITEQDYKKINAKLLKKYGPCASRRVSFLHGGGGVKPHKLPIPATNSVINKNEYLIMNTI